MKTPDEIKKALECCMVNVTESACTDCGHCPYYFVSAHCDTIMHKDVLEYIQQLEADKQQLEGLCNHMNQLRDAAAGRALQLDAEKVELSGTIDQLETKNHQLITKCNELQAEQDAAIRDMTEIVQKYGESYCEYCKNWERNTCPPYCRTHSEGFRWRGVQKEE